MPSAPPLWGGNSPFRRRARPDYTSCELEIHLLSPRPLRSWRKRLSFGLADHLDWA